MKQKYNSLFVFLICVFAIQNLASQNRLTDSKYGLIISNYLKESNEFSKSSSTDLEDIYVSRELFSEKTSIANVYLIQRYKGIKIFNAISSVGIKNDKVFHFANNFKVGISKKINSVTSSISPVQAIQKASTYFKLGNVTGLELLESKDNSFIYSKSNISQENITVEQVYFEMPDGNLKLAWDLNIYTLDGKHWWSVRVDAATGTIIDKNDWVVNCTFEGNHTEHGLQNDESLNSFQSFNLFKNAALVADGSQYNVFPLPFESPNHGSRQLVSDPSNIIASPFGWHDTNGVAGAEYTITRGNNVWALDDINADDGTDGSSPDGTSSLSFNFSLDLNQEPVGYLDVSTTNLFYWNNIMHDIWYQYGFDEASGNFQANNYGNGGSASDYVIAETQDGEDVDNANFATPPDGSNGKMQMYLWDGIQTLPHLTINGGTLAGGYNAALPSKTGGDDGLGNITRPSKTPVIGDIIIVDDGTANPTEGCSVLINGASVNGKIALIKRGSCNFTVKIQNAQDAGAIAVIIANHNNPTNDPTYTNYVNMYGVTDPVFTIPSIFINYTDGESIINAIGNGETINVTIVDNTPIQLDGSLDNGIVIHEYGHGISTRLTGGAANSNCLSSIDSGGLGEGWSDWFTLMLTMKSSDIGETGRGIGTYAWSDPINGLGIRTRQYSTNFAINEYTFGATNDNTVIGTDPDTGNPVNLNRSVHYIGTIWATMLWDLTWAYIDKYGFDPDLYNGTGGNNKIMQIVIDALKLQSCNPTMFTARNAILAADTALTGGEDQCLIWEVFANRGLGANASLGAFVNPNDQVEDFTTPDPSTPSLANCTTLSTDEFSLDDYKIYPNPSNSKLTIKTNKNLGDAVISMFDINGRKVLSRKTTLLGEIELNINSLQSGIYILNIKGDYINTNNKIIKN